MLITTLKILLGFFLTLFLIGTAFLVSGSLRDSTFRALVEFPGAFYYFQLRSPMINRDFPGAVKHLNNHLDIVKRFADGRNTMIPGLLANTKFVVEQAVFADEFAALLPYLERLTSYQKDLFPALIWKAKAFLETDPGKVFAYADAARTLIPTDERPYRLAIEAALSTREIHRIKLLCSQYRNAKLGAYHFYEFNTLFKGSGLRKFGLEILNSKSHSNRLLTHAGPSIGHNIAYEFPLFTPETVKKLRFHFSTPPGLSIKINSISFFFEGKLQANLSQDQYIVSSRNGFSTDKATVTTSRAKELLVIHPYDSFGVRADKVIAKISVSRLAILNHPGCSGD